MKLSELSPAEGSVRQAYRKGRGAGSGNGKVSKKVTVKASAFSASAKEAIEAAGGKAEVM